MKTLRHLLCFLTAVLISATSAHATPYASACTNINGTIQFILNEQPTSCYVVLDGTVTNTIPSPVVGTNTFSLGGHTTYAIYVSKNGTGVPSQIPIDSGGANYTNWAYPRGVAINCNPTNGDLFGLVYVAHSDPGGTPSKGQGLFILNSDFSPAEGTTLTGLTDSTWASGNTSSPYKLNINPTDNTVWVGDYSSTHAGIYQFDPYLQQPAVQILAGVGSSADPNIHQFSLGRPNATGSLANGNLVVWMVDNYMTTVATNALGGNGGINPNQNGYGTSFWDQNYSYTDTLGNIGEITAPAVTPALFRYTIGSGPLPWNNVPDYGLATGLNYPDTLAENDIAPDGKIFVAAERQDGSAPTLDVYDSTGMTNLWCAKTQSGDNASDDIIAAAVAPVDGGLWAPFSVKVSPDDKYVALLGYYGWIAVASLTNGVPDGSTITVIPNSPYTAAGREIGWDAADNLYMASSGIGGVYSISLGLTATCVTSNDATGKHGSFQMTTPSAVISVLTTQGLASQNYGTPIPGTFVITNSGSTAAQLNVQFTMSGSATNGQTYTLSTNGVNLPLSSTYNLIIPAGQNSLAVTLTPSESIGSAVTLYANINLVGSVSYAINAPASGTVAIANTGPQALGITGVQYPSMYRGITNDFCSFIVTRYGDTNAATYSIPGNAFTLGGTAVAGSDYTLLPSSVTVNQGDQYEVVTNLGDPVSTGVYKGNETITATLNGNAGQTISPASQTVTMTLIDNANPPETLLWSDNMTNALDSANWTLTFANSNLGPSTVPPVVIPNYPNYTSSNPDPNAVDDFDVEFGYNLANDGIGLSPTMIANGWSNALKMTVNKNPSYVAGHGASAGVNVYPQGKKFTGNYALRFSMNLTEGTTSTTEFNLFGINHYGTNCNWFAEDISTSLGNATTNSDGVWYWVDADTDGAGAALGFVNVTGQPLPNTGWAFVQDEASIPFTNVFKNPIPYNVSPGGAPADGVGTAPASTWSDVEIKQFNNVVTLSINKTPIFSYTNTTIYTNGDIMLGYDDPYASVGTVAGSGYPGAAVYYSNVRVVSLAGPTVSSTSLSGNRITIKFTSPDTDAVPGSFSLQSASALGHSTAFAPVSATITQSGTTFTAVATIPNGASAQFYRIAQTNVVQ